MTDIHEPPSQGLLTISQNSEYLFPTQPKLGFSQLSGHLYIVCFDLHLPVLHIILMKLICICIYQIICITFPYVRFLCLSIELKLNHLFFFQIVLISVGRNKELENDFEKNGETLYLLYKTFFGPPLKNAGPLLDI